MTQVRNEDPVLRLQAVGRMFGGLRAVDDVSFAVRAGESVALIGPNGAGKSTLIQIISGVDHADRGSVWLAGVDVTRLGADAISCIGVARTFQTSRVFSNLSVFESASIGFHANLLGRRGPADLISPGYELVASVLGLPSWRARVAEQRDRVEATLELFGDRLLPRRHHSAGSLSYANRRRLDIARALVGDPKVLLLDEPAAGMNPTESAELADLLLSLRELRPAMQLLVVEHKLSFVRRVSERVLVLVQGKLIMDGTPAVVFEHPDVVAAYLGKPTDSSAGVPTHG